ncbi:MAG: SCP2 sterol-binding domain-containing protein [Promethearchaeia archaeon]
MPNFERVRSILKSLDDPKRDGTRLFKKLFRHIIDDFNNIEEMNEEIKGLEEIYQISIPDLDTNFWIEFKNRKVFIKEDVHPNPELTISIRVKVLKKLIEGSVNISEAYMKGLTKLEGDLSHAIKLRNLLNYWFEWLEKPKL